MSWCAMVPRAFTFALVLLLVSCCFADMCTENVHYQLYSESGSLGCDSYGEDLEISWFISVDENERILLSFSSFDTESNFDVVSVYDGATTDSPSLGSSSGSFIPGPFRSSANRLLVVFTSDSSLAGEGFAAEWSAFQIAEGSSPCSTSEAMELQGSEGNFGCNGYGNDIHSSWHITGNVGEKIILSFATFNLEAQYDFLSVYDGSNESAEQIGQFSGTTLPVPITATSNELYITIDSDYSINKSGFTAEWTSLIEFIDPCFNSTSKVLITYEGYLGCEFGYGNFVETSWLITLIGDYVIQLDFLTFDLEDVYDWVTVYDGATTNARMIGSYSGSELPERIVSSRNRLLITLSSDAAVTGNGFTAAYQSAHALQAGGCSSSGSFVLTDPEDSFGCDGYLSGVTEEWHILAQNSHQVINLVWHKSDLQRDHDFVYVYDGNSTDATLLQTNTDGTLPDPVRSSGASLLVVLVADSDNIQGEGIRAIYQSVVVPDDEDSAACSGTHNNLITEERGSFGCAGYADNSLISWQIHVQDDYSILLHFNGFFTEAGADTVTIYDGPDAESYPLGSFSGAFRPPPLASSSSYLFVVFSSDEGVTRAGFQAEYESVFSGNDAGSCYDDATFDLTEDSGSFGCSGYGDDVTESWNISVSAGNLISIDFVHFETEFNEDFLTIYDGDSANYPILASYSGPSVPPVVSSTGNRVFVEFTSDSSISYSGFTANYHAIEDPNEISSCTVTTHETLTAPSDQFGCNGYAASIDPTWLIVANESERITLRFTMLNTEAFYDYVEVFDGANEAATLLGTFSGSSSPNITLTSASESLFVHFHSDSSLVLDGFTMQYATFGSFLQICDESRSYSLDGPTGTFGCDSYTSGITVSWSIESFASIFVNFERFDTEVNYDVVSVYDGSDATAPLIGAFSGSQNVRPVYSTGNSMFVVFVTDASVTRSGFTANFATALFDEEPAVLRLE